MRLLLLVASAVKACSSVQWSASSVPHHRHAGQHVAFMSFPAEWQLLLGMCNFNGQEEKLRAMQEKHGLDGEQHAKPKAAKQ